MKTFRFIAMILAFTMFVGISANAAASESNEVFDLLSLGIIVPNEDGQFIMSAPVTRAEFAAMVVRLMEYDELTQIDSDGIFSDLTDAHPYADQIVFLVQSGLMNKISEKTVEPDRQITLEEAASTLIGALGYKNVLTYSDCFTVARSIGLIKKINNTDKLIMSDVVQLLYNVLDIEHVLQTDSGDYKKQNITFRSLRENKHNKSISKLSGIVTANADSYLHEPNDALENTQVEIDDKVYNVGNTIAAEYFGMHVTFFVEDASKSVPVIISIMATSKNNTLSIDDEDIYSFSSKELRYGDTGKTVFKISPQARILYGGRPLNSYSEADFKVNRGCVKLIDNNDDKSADIVMIEEYTNVLVKGVRGNIIELEDPYKFNGSKYINIKTDDDVHYILKDKDNKLISAENITSGCILSIITDKHKEVYKFIVSADTAEGNISGLTNDTVEINDTQYPYYKADNFDFNFTDTLKLYLDYRGYVACVKKVEGSRNFGYIVGIDNGLFGTTTVKMLCGSVVEYIYEKNTENLDDTNTIPKLKCRNSEIKELTVDDKTLINGIRYAKNQGILQTGIYEYDLRSDGGIKELKSPVLVGGGTGMKYMPYDKIFGGNSNRSPFAIDDKTVVICVPRNQVSGDDDYLVPLEISAQSSSITYEVLGYEYNNATKKAELIVFTEQMDCNDVTPIKRNSSSVAMVADVSKVYHKDDDSMVQVELITGSGDAKFVIDESNVVADEWKNLKKGDLIYYSKKLDGTAGHAERIYSFSNISDNGFIKYEGAQNEQYLGNVLDFSYNEIDLKSYSLVVKTTLNCAGLIKEVNLAQRNTPPIFAVDRNGKNVYLSDLSDVDVGSDRLYVITYYGTITGCVAVK